MKIIAFFIRVWRYFFPKKDGFQVAKQRMISVLMNESRRLNRRLSRTECEMMAEDVMLSMYPKDALKRWLNHLGVYEKT